MNSLTSHTYYSLFAVMLFLALCFTVFSSHLSEIIGLRSMKTSNKIDEFILQDDTIITYKHKQGEDHEVDRSS